jgi:hypothetical protein
VDDLGDLARQVEGPQRELDEIRETLDPEARSGLRADPESWPPEHKQRLLTWVRAWKGVLPEYSRYFGRHRGRTITQEEIRQLWEMLTSLYASMLAHVFDQQSVLGRMSPDHQEGARLESPGFLGSWDDLMLYVDPYYNYLKKIRASPGYKDQERMHERSQTIRDHLVSFVTATLEEFSEIETLIERGG